MVSRSRIDARADGDVSGIPRRTDSHRLVRIQRHTTRAWRAPREYAGYLGTGHPWEAIFENWESEFLQMAVFVLLTTWLVQKGSPESRRPGAKELVDTDPRDFAHDPEGPVAGQARRLDPAAL